MQKYSTAGSLVSDPSRKAEKFVREVSGRRRRNSKQQRKRRVCSCVHQSGVKRREHTCACRRSQRSNSAWHTAYIKQDKNRPNQQHKATRNKEQQHRKKNPHSQEMDTPQRLKARAILSSTGSPTSVWSSDAKITNWTETRGVPHVFDFCRKKKAKVRGFAARQQAHEVRRGVTDSAGVSRALKLIETMDPAAQLESGRPRGLHQ